MSSTDVAVKIAQYLTSKVFQLSDLNNKVGDWTVTELVYYSAVPRGASVYVIRFSVMVIVQSSPVVFDTTYYEIIITRLEYLGNT